VNEDEAMIETSVEPKLGNRKGTQWSLRFKSYSPRSRVRLPHRGTSSNPNKALKRKNGEFKK